MDLMQAIYARWLDNELLFPTFLATVQALRDGFTTGPLLGRTLRSATCTRHRKKKAKATRAVTHYREYVSDILLLERRAMVR